MITPCFQVRATDDEGNEHDAVPGETSAVRDAVDPLNGDHVAVYHIQNPVAVDSEPAVRALWNPSAGSGSSAKPATTTPIARMPSWSCMKRRAEAAAARVHRIFTGCCRAVRP
jgi:hypothetical protein